MMSGATIFGCSGTDLTRDEKAFFADADPLGFILFARNVETPEQVSGLCSALRGSVGRDAPILIDQEGGRVQRMTQPHWRQWLPPLDQLGDLAGETAYRCMYLRYRIIASELRGSGVDVNCAPSGDIAMAQTHPFLRNRCYGNHPDVVVNAARGVAAGLLAGGVLPVMKHIPGHGRATLDSHKALPRVATDRATLDETDFAVFRGLADLPMAMTAHIVYDAIDPERPATQSPDVIALIRQQIGFDGLLMTDDMSMEALSGTPGERASASLAAGCDVALHCNGTLDEMVDVAHASGTLSQQAARRVSAALGCRRSPDDADPLHLMQEFAELTGATHLG